MGMIGLLLEYRFPFLYCERCSRSCNIIVMLAHLAVLYVPYMVSLVFPSPQSSFVRKEENGKTKKKLRLQWLGLSCHSQLLCQWTVALTSPPAVSSRWACYSGLQSGMPSLFEIRRFTPYFPVFTHRLVGILLWGNFFFTHFTKSCLVYQQLAS